jgi:AcrR family transcriptional regulator
MAGARARVTSERLLEAAVRLLDEHGPEALTLTAVAQELGVRTPSLYHHVGGLDALRRRLRLHGLEVLGEALQRASAGRAHRAALEAVAEAYLAFGRRQPGLYALTLAGAATGDDERVRRAGERVLETMLAVLHGYGLEGDDALHATRFARSALHGFVALERAGGFAMPLDREASSRRLVAAIDAGLTALARGDGDDGRN